MTQIAQEHEPAPKFPSLRERIDMSIAQHNGIVDSIAAAQKQIAIWHEERIKLLGKIEAQREILKDQESEALTKTP